MGVAQHFDLLDAARRQIAEYGSVVTLPGAPVQVLQQFARAGAALLALPHLPG